jgi:hypothetical protein
VNPLAVRAALVAGLLAALAACAPEPTPAPPQGLELEPLPRESSVELPGNALTAPAPVAQVSAPAPGGPSGPGVAVGTAPAGAAGQGLALGYIPVPTPRPAATVAATGPPATDPAIVSLLGQVYPNRLAADVRTLSGFGTRHANSSTDSEQQGVGAARDWLMTQLDLIGARSAAQVITEWEDFPLSLAGQESTQRNLIATLTGIGATKRFVYVVAHYDSRTEDIADASSSAPGADDNASGTATLLELARVLGSRQWDASIRLIAFAAEEPGLKGSRHHAPLAKQAGLPIEAVISNDIVGGGAGEDGAKVSDRIRAFSAGPEDGPSRRLARYARLIGQRYGLPALELQAVADRPDRGGDHQPFSDEGFAALRFISAVEDMSRQHNAQDTPERLDPAYQAQIVRLNIATVANLALAPPAPAEAPALAALGDGSLRVSWSSVAAPGVAGYYVAWRPAGELAYRDAAWAGGGTSFDLTGLPPGRVAVAVAASDELGHMSLFSPEAQR